MDSMCIYPTVSTEQMSMLFFICLFVGFTFFWLSLSYCFLCLFFFCFYCFFYQRPISQRWNSDNQDTKERMDERIGVFWLSKQDFQKERTKVCTRVCVCSQLSEKVFKITYRS